MYQKNSSDDSLFVSRQLYLICGLSKAEICGIYCKYTILFLTTQKAHNIRVIEILPVTYLFHVVSFSVMLQLIF